MAQDVVKIESFTFSIPIGTSNTWKGDINVPSGHKRLKAVLLLPGNYDSTGTKIGLNDKDGSKILGDIPILALKDNIVFNPNSPNTSFVNLDRPTRSIAYHIYWEALRLPRQTLSMFYFW